MIAVALAAAVTVQVGAPPKTERMPNLYHQPARCGDVVEREVARQKTAFNGEVPIAQYAVLRSIDGCAVPTPVGYHPSYVLPGAADPAAKPEDERSRRR